MSVSGKKILPQPRPALTESNPKASSASGANRPSKAVSSAGMPKATGLSNVKESTATSDKDAILQECLRKLVGKRVSLLKLLNSADVNPSATRPQLVTNPPYSFPPYSFSETRMWHHLPAIAETMSRHSRLWFVAGPDECLNRHRSSR